MKDKPTKKDIDEWLKIKIPPTKKDEYLVVVVETDGLAWEEDVTVAWWNGDCFTWMSHVKDAEVVGHIIDFIPVDDIDEDGLELRTTSRWVSHYRPLPIFDREGGTLR